MKVWIVYAGEYEQRGAIGPAFKRKTDAEVFAAGFNEGEDIEEFEVHTGVPVRMKHYECQGWLDDVKNTVARPTGVVHGFRICESSWDSWDVLVPTEVEVQVEPWSHRDEQPNHAHASGRNRSAVRTACVEALKSIAHPLNNSTQPTADPPEPTGPRNPHGA